MWSPLFFQFHAVWQVSSALETFVQMNMTWFDCNLISNMSLLWIKLWSLLIRSQLLYASWKNMSKISDFWIQKYHCLIRLYLTMTGSFNRPTNADWNVFYGRFTSKNTFFSPKKWRRFAKISASSTATGLSSCANGFLWPRVGFETEIYSFSTDFCWF